MLVVVCCSACQLEQWKRCGVSVVYTHVHIGTVSMCLLCEMCMSSKHLFPMGGGQHNMDIEVEHLLMDINAGIDVSIILKLLLKYSIIITSFTMGSIHRNFTVKSMGPEHKIIILVITYFHL